MESMKFNYHHSPSSDRLRHAYEGQTFQLLHPARHVIFDDLTFPLAAFWRLLLQAALPCHLIRSTGESICWLVNIMRLPYNESKQTRSLDS